MTLDEIHGQTVHVSNLCGAQFADGRDLTLRVTGVVASKSWDGMAWLTGYVLNRHGAAVERREVYVIVAGLRAIPALKPPVRRARNTGPRIPRQRTTSTTATTTGSPR